LSRYALLYNLAFLGSLGPRPTKRNFSISPGKKGGFSEVGYFRHSREGGNPA